MALSIQIRRDTEENWNFNNPILLEGEIGAVIEESGLIGRFKIGNGLLDWKSLPFVSTGTEYENEITVIKEAIDTINADITTLTDKSDKNTTDIETLSKDVEEISGNLNTLTTDLGTFKTEVGADSTNIHTAINGLTDRVTETEKGVVENKVASLSAVKVADETSAKVDVLNTTFTQKTDNLTTLVDELTAEIEELSANLKDTTVQISDNLDAIEETIEELSAKIDESGDYEALSAAISAKADTSALTELKDDVEVSLENKANKIHTHKINEVDGLQDELNSKLTSSSTIQITNVVSGTHTLPELLDNKVGYHTPGSVLIENEIVIGAPNGITITPEYIGTHETGKKYYFADDNEERIANLKDLSAIAENADKLSAINIVPANLETDDAEWVISKVGEENNTIRANLDYYQGQYQPTRLPSVKEVSSTIETAIKAHNEDLDAHDLKNKLDETLETANTNVEQKIAEHNVAEDAHENLIKPIKDSIEQHYKESLEAFTEINTTIDTISGVVDDISAAEQQNYEYVTALAEQTTKNVNYLSGNISSNVENIGILSATDNNLAQRLDTITENRWVAARTKDGEVLDNLIGSPNYGEETTVTPSPIGFYFAPYETFDKVPEEEAPRTTLYSKINSIKLTTLDSDWYEAIDSESSKQNKDINIGLRLYRYEDSVFKEITRSENYLKLKVPGESYTFTFKNAISRLTTPVVNEHGETVEIPTVIYVEFVRYETGTIERPPVKLAKVDDLEYAGLLTNPINPANDRIEKVLPVITFNYGFVYDFNDKVDRTLELLSADNIVLGWEGAVDVPSSSISSIPFIESTLISAVSSKVLTINNPDIETQEDDRYINVFPYTGTTEVLLRDKIKVTGVPDVGNIKNGDVLSVGQSITDILKKMLAVTLPVTAYAPTVSLSYNLATQVEFGTPITNGIGTVRFVDGKYIIDPNATISSQAANMNPTQYTVTFNGTGTGTSVPTTPLVVTTSPISFPNTLKLGSDGATISFNVAVDISQGDIPINNVGEEVISARLAARTLTTNTITITAKSYGYFGYDDGTRDIDGTYIKQLSRTGFISNGSAFNLALPSGKIAKRFIVAYPASLRDITSVYYVEDGNSNYTGNFLAGKLANVNVEGYTGSGVTIPYKVFAYATPADWEGPVTFRVTI